jgi:hypothetical protein
MVDIGRDEETFPIRHAVIGLQMGFFNSQAGAYAGINEYGEKLSSAFEAMDEFINIAAWRGSPSQRLFGILTYPWLRKRAIAQAYTAITSDADFETKKAALNDEINEIRDRNPGVALSLRYITSPRKIRWMKQSRHPTTRNSLFEEFMAEQSNVIASIEEAPELQGAGPGGAGEDGTLICQRGSLGPQLVMPQEMAMLPLQDSNYGFTQSQAGYASTGGVVIRGVLYSVLIWSSMV